MPKKKILNVLKLFYEGKKVVTCKLKEGAYYDSIESILEDTAYTTKIMN